MLYGLMFVIIFATSCTGESNPEPAIVIDVGKQRDRDVGPSLDLRSEVDAGSTTDIRTDIKIDMTGIDAPDIREEPCVSPLNPTDFDRFECDPYCQTGCFENERCAYGSNPVVGNVTTCAGVKPGRTQNTECGRGSMSDEYDCERGYNCTGSYCAAFCQSDEDCLPGHWCSARSLVGTCHLECEPFPARNECPSFNQCLFTEPNGRALCITYFHPRSRVGQACQYIGDCSENELCSNNVCRKICVSAEDCENEESCLPFEYFQQNVCIPT